MRKSGGDGGIGRADWRRRAGLHLRVGRGLLGCLRGRGVDC
jgi:hypothetical protein